MSADATGHFRTLKTAVHRGCELGNRVLAVNAAGDRVRFEYDARGLLTRRVSEASATSGGGVDDRFAYDGFGRQVLATSAVATRALQWDDLDRLVAVSDASFGTVRQVYDADGRRIQLVYPDGSTVHYRYTPRGELAGIRDPALAAAGGAGDWQLAYDPLGRPVARTDPFGVERRVRYRLEGWVEGVEIRASGGSLLESYDYPVYDALGNPQQVLSTEGTTEIRYDALSRVERVAYPGGDVAACQALCERFEYDAAGHRTKRVRDGVERRYGVDAAHQTTAVTDAAGTPLESFAYDAAGRRTTHTSEAGTTTSSAYDALGRLRQLQRPGYSLSLAYAPTGERASRSASGGDTAAFFGEWTELRGFTAVRVLRGHGPDDVLAEVTAAGSVRTLLRDGTANVTHVAVDGSPEPTPRRYAAFGTVRAGASPSVERGFASRPAEGASGLLYHRARHYDPEAGLFLQADPLGLDATHLYAYANHNPYRFTDPTGLDPETRAFERAIASINVEEQGRDLLCGGYPGCFTVADSVGDLVLEELEVRGGHVAPSSHAFASANHAHVPQAGVGEMSSGGVPGLRQAGRFFDGLKDVAVGGIVAGPGTALVAAAALPSLPFIPLIGRDEFVETFSSSIRDTFHIGLALSEEGLVRIRSIGNPPPLPNTQINDPLENYR